MVTLELYGKINSKGNAVYSGMERYKHILEQNVNKRIIMQLIVIEPYCSEHHVWYIIKMIIPAWIKGNTDKGILLTPEDALNEIANVCPIFYETHTKTHKIFDWTRYQPDCQIPAEELEIAIEWLHVYCLENFNLVVGNIKSI